ncbi:stage V sporulation protein AE [Ruminococcus sp.]|uniref:stage V sporulation protein AE n=1 Tax=Ruminococcus sp. TaxID=41978 RepID=UPI00388D5651
MQFLWAFLVGGALCLIGQVLIDRTSLTPARILTGFVVAGVILSAVGLYEPLVELAGEGAAVPLSGFGHLMAQGVRDAVDRDGAVGILTGALSAAAAGIGAAVVLSLAAGLVSKPKEK